MPPAPVIYFESDLASVRILGEGLDETWPAQGAPDESEASREQEPPSRRQADTARLVESAEWAQRTLSAQSRAPIVCLGVSRASCAWLRAPSADPKVVAAALRRREVNVETATVQPILLENSADPPSMRVSALKALVLKLRPTAKQPASATPRAPGAQEGVAISVIKSLDGAARVWLDGFDQSGGQVGRVISLWHAMALAWSGRADPARANGSPAGSDDLIAVVLIEPNGRVAWAWGRDGALVAGGSAALALSSDAAGPVQAAPESSGRILLDWLTWSAHLGRTPDRIIVRGTNAKRAAERLGAIWEDVPLEVEEDADPLRTTLDRARGRSIPSEPDPARMLVELSQRPGRAHRRLYLWSAAAIALFALAIAGAGWQLRAQAGDHRAQGRELREQTRQELENTAPQVANDPSPVRALRALVQQRRDASPQAAGPPPPRPILDELLLVVQAIESMDELDGSISQIEITDGQSTLAFRFSDFRAEDVLAKIRDLDGEISWSAPAPQGLPPNVTIRPVGTWKLFDR